jgi:hypothetical protein
VIVPRGLTGRPVPGLGARRLIVCAARPLGVNRGELGLAAEGLPSFPILPWYPAPWLVVKTETSMRMMMTPRELDVVRVTSTGTVERTVDGSPGVVRQPAVGDVGTIVHVIGPTKFIVECVDTEGATVWITDFDLDEIQVVDQRPAE